MKERKLQRGTGWDEDMKEGKRENVLHISAAAQSSWGRANADGIGLY